MTLTPHAHDPATDLGATLVENDVVTHANARRGLAVLRIGYGVTFLWAFFDKLLALGFHTGYDQNGNLDRFGPGAWVNGGSPTEGFLTRTRLVRRYAALR